MPGARAAKSSDMSTSERLKFGASASSSGATTVPGAQSANSSDMSTSERLKFGAASSSS
eukprot:CAMPEP_0172299852 /NCGR_PEP_ID=MMETSP1058-20130122/2048_1 /TAXON_ID=83371 /ORGANISM="Detonula confervacea, Strain CCMP 353" /LENGTH=58 /DNA_ID=CAMNT_0013009423 /DNA_START=48 /DNA_END=220 /DNA_ORIENTATION=-